MQFSYTYTTKITSVFLKIRSISGLQMPWALFHKYPCYWRDCVREIDYCISCGRITNTCITSLWPMMWNWNAALYMYFRKTVQHETGNQASSPPRISSLINYLDRSKDASLFHDVDLSIITCVMFVLSQNYTLKQVLNYRLYSHILSNNLQYTQKFYHHI